MPSQNLAQLFNVAGGEHFAEMLELQIVMRFSPTAKESRADRITAFILQAVLVFDLSNEFRLQNAARAIFVPEP